ncbi:competence protein CelA [Lactococcus piscium]|uniref:Competence protein CelA n=1 Tax=Pseudolactococcus piscium TaxID=1364 RepID=A0A2A5RVY3_9LACT|nr:helix-hairpin-helix domain-containing protein [Lactococcus piscium]PCS05354.1 competence protein CelA [Lactococcus piscium]
MQIETMIEKIKHHRWLLIGLLIPIMVIGLLVVIFAKQDTASSSVGLVSSTQLNAGGKSEKGVKKMSGNDKKTTAKETERKDRITVDLKGAVKKPAVYTLKQDSRVNDLLLLAGGVTDQADTKSINLAQKLTDEMVVYVASIGEDKSAEIVGTKAHDDVDSAAAQAIDKININTADLAQLQKLSGVGLKKAQDIIDYREQNGKFNQLEDLGNVSGFGEKSLEKLKESVAVD